MSNEWLKTCRPEVQERYRKEAERKRREQERKGLDTEIGQITDGALCIPIFPKDLSDPVYKAAPAMAQVLDVILHSEPVNGQTPKQWIAHVKALAAAAKGGK